MSSDSSISRSHSGMLGFAGSTGGSGVEIGSSNPVASAQLAAAARDRFLHTYVEGQTIFDRFKDIPAPGGLRMLHRISECYEVFWFGLGGSSFIYKSLPET